MNDEATPITSGDDLYARVALPMSRRQIDDPPSVRFRCGAGYIVERTNGYFLVDSNFANPVLVKGLSVGND